MGSIKIPRFHGCAVASINRDEKMALVSIVKIMIVNSTEELSGPATFSHRGESLYFCLWTQRFILDISDGYKTFIISPKFFTHDKTGHIGISLGCNKRNQASG